MLGTLTSCVEEPEIPQIQISENGELMKVKSWFDENKTKLRLPERGSNLRTESEELILPFFEKEPDWDKFHHYYFPDGREVFEVSLENAEKYYPKSFLDSFPNQNVSEIMVQNIMFIKSQGEDRFDPLIARYYPDNEYSISKMKNISYGGMNEYWSGRIDVFTYDEHHYVGFLINEGKIEKTVRYGLEENSSSRTLGDCQVVTREVVWTSPGPASEDPLGIGVTIHSITISETFCTGSAGEFPTTGTVYVEGEPYYQFGSGNEGCSECDYLIPIISDPQSIILNQLTNPCASGIFKQLMKSSNLRSSVGHLNQMDEIIELLNNANDFDFIVKNSDNINNQTDPTIKYNTETGKNEVTIYFQNSYLQSATKLSIARTILHESVHAYLLYIGTINDNGIIQNGLINYGLTNGVPLGNVHHGFMAQYVEAIGYSLNKWNDLYGGSTSIPRSYFDDIAWGGLSAKSYDQVSDVYTWHDSFKVIIESETERRRIESNIYNEYVNNNDAESNPC